MVQVEMHNPASPAAQSAPAPAVEAPSATIVRAANQPNTCTDAQGRVIVWKKLGAFDNMRLAEIVGAGNIANGQYMLYANTAYSVVSINGAPEPKPHSKRELEALVQRLGDDGIGALWDSAREHGPKFGGEEGADADAPKDGPGTPS